jgi:uncharacterized protein (DUF885 family)
MGAHAMSKVLYGLLMMTGIAWLANSAVGERRGSADARLQRLLADAWEFDLNENPTFATSVGDLRSNDKLASATVEDYQRRLQTRREFIVRAEKIVADQLTPEGRTNLKIFLRLQHDDIRELEFESYLIPITNRSGFHIWFPELPKQVPLKTVQQYEDYVARLRDFRRYAGENIALMRVGIEKGAVLPSVVLEGYHGAITPHIVTEPRQSLLYEPATRWPSSFSDEDKQHLDGEITAAIMSSVVPAYQDFQDFMEQEYVPAARGSIGASGLPSGREYYRHRVRKYSTLDITPEEVHQLGLSEVARIRKEMTTVMEEVKFDGELNAFFDHLRTAPQFYATTPEQLQKEIAYVLKRMDGQLPRLFKTLPRMPYGIRVIPEYIAPRTTAAYYSPPPGDQSRAGFYYINTYNLKSRPLYQVEALSLHEAVPGHHLQIALQQELEGLPNFRKYAGFTVFVEGWALYAERLGLEVGFYQDPYSNFGRLSYEMWRACRLVVDTGMHYQGWTRQQTIDYMSSNTALSHHNITAEVDRYIAWPGQALAYKIGELKIRELRSRAEMELGDAFDIRDFHAVVLGSGSVPLDVLEENVTGYIRDGATTSN